MEIRKSVRPFRSDLIPGTEDLPDDQVLERVKCALHAGQPLDLEIGCGVGWHPIRYARAFPDRTLIAVERTSEKFRKFESRLDRHPRLANLIPVHGDATSWVTHHLPDESLDRILILYPNPNGKNPQARWVRMPFFGHLLMKLKRAGTIEFRTNIAEYAGEIRDYGLGEWNLQVAVDEELAFPREGLTTHFEQKYLERGEPCYRIVLSREKA